jgi:hypothetical protein
MCLLIQLFPSVQNCLCRKLIDPVSPRCRKYTRISKGSESEPAVSMLVNGHSHVQAGASCFLSSLSVDCTSFNPTFVSFRRLRRRLAGTRGHRPEHRVVLPRRAPFADKQRRGAPGLAHKTTAFQGLDGSQGASGARGLLGSSVLSTDAQPPLDLENTVETLSDSILKAVNAGCTRLRCLVALPGINEKLETTVPYSETLLFALTYAFAQKLTATNFYSIGDELNEVRLVFSSAGKANAAKSLFDELGDVTPCGEASAKFSCFGEESANATWDASELLSKKSATWRGFIIIVEPRNLRGDSAIPRLENLIQQQMQALDVVSSHGPGRDFQVIWILLNPYLEDQADNVTLSIREIDRRRQFLYSFQIGFFMEPIVEILRPDLIAVEHGVLIRSFGENWNVFACSPTRLHPASWQRAMQERSKIVYTKVGTLDQTQYENRQPGDDEVMCIIRKLRNLNQAGQSRESGSERELLVGVLLAVIFVTMLIIGENKDRAMSLLQSLGRGSF